MSGSKIPFGWFLYKADRDYAVSLKVVVHMCSAMTFSESRKNRFYTSNASSRVNSDLVLVINDGSLPFEKVILVSVASPIPVNFSILYLTSPNDAGLDSYMSFSCSWRVPIYYYSHLVHLS